MRAMRLDPSNSLALCGKPLTRESVHFGGGCLRGSGVRGIACVRSPRGNAGNVDGVGLCAVRVLHHGPRDVVAAVLEHAGSGGWLLPALHEHGQRFLAQETASPGSRGLLAVPCRLSAVIPPSLAVAAAGRRSSATFHGPHGVGLADVVRQRAPSLWANLQS